MNKNYLYRDLKQQQYTFMFILNISFYKIKNSSYIKSNMNIIRILNRNDLQHSQWKGSLDKIQFQLTDKKINIKIAIF